MRLVLGFFSKGSFSALTFLSWCVGVTAVGTSGCADSVRLSRARTTELVAEYSKEHDTVLVRNGRRYRLTPENRLELELGDEPDFSAPLERLRTNGKNVVFPDGAQVNPEELESAHLVVRGERLTRLASTGKLSASERWLLGAQIGGTGFLQGVARLRVVGPLHLEFGGLAFGPPAMMNLSAGLVVDIPVTAQLVPYVGGGVGYGVMINETLHPECQADPDCPIVAVADSLSFGHARLGIAYRFVDRHLRIGLDGGFWYGTHVEDWEGGPTHDDRVFIPMAGFSILHEL
jgi:hypothetical protein